MTPAATLTVDRPRPRPLVAVLATALIGALVALIALGAEPAHAQANGFACEADAGTLTWTDHETNPYWTYRSLDDGATFQWLGKTLGATTLTDRNPVPGAIYQVHYQGIPRVECTTIAEPTGPVLPTFACEANEGVLSWTDHQTSPYWTYQSVDGGATYQWLGKTLGATTLTDVTPAPGTRYQVHYQGIPRVECDIVAEPTGPVLPPFSCSEANGVLTWTDHNRNPYWTYRSVDGGASYQWLGKTLGATTLTDPNPVDGALYQVHYQGIPRFYCTSGPAQPTWSPLPANVPFDYQIGQPYTLPSGVGVVSRDWFDASPAANAYNICYVNAFQTQGDYGGYRPDERGEWPQNLVLSELGDDPNWGGEYLIDISTATKRQAAADWVDQMIQGCADKGYDAVEYDNLDSWTRFDETDLAGQVPFGQAEAILYARLITDAAHDRGLAVAQKNTASLTADQALNQVGFDFAVVESCGVYDECDVFTDIYGDQVVAIEYGSQGFNSACSVVGSEISVVRRDRDVTAPGSNSYIRQEC